MSDYRDLMDELATMSGVFSDNVDTIEHFDDRKFRFSCMLVNQDGYVFRIRKSAIRYLKIVDSLVEWFHYGQLDMDNPNDIMERPVGELSLSGAFSRPAIPYNFRADARDLLYIYMEPYIGDDRGGITPKIDNEVYTMRMLFSIYKIDDIADGQEKARNKGQRFHFHDYRYQSLMEKNTYYSTSKNLPAIRPGQSTLTSRVPVTQTNNTDRGKPTGEIIQDIFRSVFMKSDIVKKFSYDWSFGANSILYTSPSNFRAIDDINYLLDRHSNESGDPCILKLDRYSNMWSFLPLSKYFERSTDGDRPGILQSEDFKISFDGDGPDSTGNTIPPSSKSFTAAGNPMINYHFPDLSVIDDYTFSEMDGTDCQLFLDSTVVTRHSQSKKQFSLDLPDHNIGTIRDYFDGAYTKMVLGSGGGAVPAWLTDTSRTSYFNFSVVDSWTSDQTASLSVSRSKKILSAVMLGNSIYFDVKGFTPRRSGVWFTLDRQYQYLEGDYDKKVLGQYFATRVEHVIRPGSYTNTIIGVKPFLFNDSGGVNGTRTSNDITYTNTDEVINE